MEPPEDSHSPVTAISKGAKKRNNTAEEPVKPEEPDNYEEGSNGIHEEKTPKDQSDKTHDKQEPPWEEGSHRVRYSCFCGHFAVGKVAAAKAVKGRRDDKKEKKEEEKTEEKK